MFWEFLAGVGGRLQISKGCYIYTHPFIPIKKVLTDQGHHQPKQQNLTWISIQAVVRFAR